MPHKKTTKQYKTLELLANRIRNDLKSRSFVLLFAYNGIGKTRLSNAFTDAKKKPWGTDTLCFNALIEDLFYWDNEKNYLRMAKSNFFKGFAGYDMNIRIRSFLDRYADFDFDIDYRNSRITFSRSGATNIKISRGEENIFIWCIFLAVCRLAIERHPDYKWVKNFYIDDPISSLDDNNTITVAHDLANLLKEENSKIKTVISTHHSLFFNIMWNEIRRTKQMKAYLLNRPKNLAEYTLHSTDETPFFYHIAMLSEMEKSIENGDIYTYHFNIMRSILEKISTFFGYERFADCLEKMEDKGVYSRAVDLLSHGKYSIYDPAEMGEDNKKLFIDIFNYVKNEYKFNTSGFKT